MSPPEQIVANRESKARHQAVSPGLQGGRADGSGALRSERGTACGEEVWEGAGRYELWRTSGLAATMEGLMAAVVALDASPLNVLRSMRGAIVDAQIGYPEILHVEIKDAAGELWHLATQDAEWSPSDPAQLVGRSVNDADIDEETGELRCKLSDGSLLEMKPAAREAEDDPPNWELITPGGIVLEFGPGVRWQIGSVDDRAS